MVANVTVAELRAFANEIAAHLGGAQTEAVAGAQAAVRPQGVIYSAGGHIILEIPPAEFLLVRE